MDLIREILFTIEERADYSVVYVTRELLPKYSQDDIDYHVDLLVDAELIRPYPFDGNVWRGKLLQSSLSDQIPVVRLTWEGHEFLDSARDNGLWAAAKQRISDTGVTVTLEILKAILLESLKQRFGLQ